MEEWIEVRIFLRANGEAYFSNKLEEEPKRAYRKSFVVKMKKDDYFGIQVSNNGVKFFK